MMSKVFDSLLGEAIPPDFQAAKIFLDGKMTSDLNWKKELEVAHRHVEKGLWLFWELDLGLFSRLEHSLADQMQYHSLCLALEHFSQHVLRKFADRTVGVSLYRGSADFSKEFARSQEHEPHFQEWLAEFFPGKKNAFREQLWGLFCRDVAVDYCSLLCQHLYLEVPCFLLLDPAGLKDPLHQLQVLSQEHFGWFQLAVKDPFWISHEWIWEKGVPTQGFIASQPLKMASPPSIGVCLPSLAMLGCGYEDELGPALSWLAGQKIPFRVIPESMLTTEWEGLDVLLVAPKGLSSQGERKLKGFCAAGGKVVSLGSPLGLPLEVPFAKWKSIQPQRAQRTQRVFS